MLGPLLLTLLPVADSVSLTGRLLDHVGEPLPKASIELSAAPADPELAATWAPPSGFSGANGRFALRFVPPGVPVACRITLPNGDRLTTTWHGLVQGDLELGEIRLPATSTVAGRIHLPNGDTLTGGWSVVLDLESLLPCGLRLRAPRKATPSRESGEFRVEVPALPVRVTANHVLGLRIAATLEHLPAGGEVFVPLVHHGPDPRGMLRVQLVHPIRRELSDDAVSVTDAAGRQHTGSAHGQVVSFEGLAPGLARVEVVDPFYTAGTTFAPTGQPHQVAVRGSASLILTVFEGDAQAERYGLRVTYFRERAGPQASLRSDASPRPEFGIVEDLLPAPLWLEVRPVTGEVTFVPINDLQPGSLGAYEVHLPRTISRTLVLVDGSGRRLVARDLAWRHTAHERSTGGVERVDDEGRLTLRLAAGRLKLELAGDPPITGVLAWSDELPDPIEVQLSAAQAGSRR
ncbi:MAG: carboxypeptidase-like regulatory domain-containing protein [Planctomycetota bacterium]|nr:carboxypeptidase-like regulatory domain-containing protein [Planctomycetota bacterium]